MLKINHFLIDICLGLLFFALVSGTACSSDVGKVWPSEKRTWVDAEFGREITQWTSHSAKSWHLYFNIETFTDENHAIIISERTGSPNFFLLNLQNGEMVQMTDENGINPSRHWHWPQYRTLYYMAGLTLKALNTQTFAAKIITSFGEIKPRSFTVTCDGKWVVFACDKMTEREKSKPNAYIGPYAIYKISVDGGQAKQISPDLGFMIGHLQASPTDPRRITYCWQHRATMSPRVFLGETPQRIWWINIDGTDGGPVGVQEFGLHRTHEFWFPDGSRIGYSARYKFGPNKGKQFLGSCAPDGSDNYMMPAPISFAHSQMYKDKKHWVVDLYNGSVLTLLTIKNRKIANVEPLFRHDSSWHGQPSHPHPHFSPNG